MKTRITLPVVLALALAGSAAAATTGSVSGTLTPNKVGKASTLNVSATGPFSFSGQPQSAKFVTQKGFKSSPKSVRVLCSSSQESSGSCPSQSKIGSGTAQATGTLPPFPPQHDNITFTLYLGVPQQGGDIASVVIVGTDTYFKSTLHSVGRLFRSGRRLELLFTQFPTVSNIPAGTQVTLDKLQFTAGAKRTVKKGKRKHRHKVRYSLITNPSTCTGHWTGTLTLTFSNGTWTKSISTPCKK